MPNNNINNVQLRSDEIQEILTKVPHWLIRWGSVLFLFLIILFIMISWFIKYPDTIESEAMITTEIPPQQEFAKISGKFDAIFISNNQLVDVKEPLAVIENSANYKDVFKLQSILDTIKVNNKSFHFPIDSLPVLFLGDIDAQYALFENNYIQYILNKKLKPFSNELLASNLSISELNRRLENLQLQKRLNKSELEYKKKDLLRSKSLFEKGVISAQKYENKQLEYSQAERNYNAFESSISQIRESIGNAHKVSKGTEINRVKEEMILLKNVIQSFNQLKKAIKDWEYLYVLRSNIKGKVSFLTVWDINQTVNQGDLVFTIIPSENSNFIAKLKTPVQNSGKIKLGQEVTIKLENYPDKEFGVLVGKVENISLVPDNDGLYYVDVRLPKKLITSYKKEIEFKQDMVGVAKIITEDLRLIERFFYRIKDMLTK